MLGHIQFFAGSVLFLEQFHAYKPIGVWLFISGAFMMLIGNLGSAIVKLYDRKDTG